MKILSLSDVELETMYKKDLKERYPDIDMVIGCGDLPMSYLEFIVNSLGVPLYYVRGNHAPRIIHSYKSDFEQPTCGVNLHHRVYHDCRGTILAGIEGSLSYNRGPHQYTQGEMWELVLSMAPKLMLNRMLYGRYLDIFVTHAPPWKIHDEKDLPHQGIKAFVWFDKVFKPRYHLHGHIHVYKQYTKILTELGATKILNTFGFQISEY
jgi:uncharacterized protein